MRRMNTDDGPGGPSWLDTYADMVTLILTFFVLLFAISSVNEQKWQMIVQSFGDRGPQIVIPNDSSDPPADDGLVNLPGAGGEGINDEKLLSSIDEVVDFDDLYLYLKKYIQDNNLTSDVELAKGENYTFIIFRNNIFFDGNSAELKPEGQKILDVLAQAFEKLSDQIGSARFEGHTAKTNESFDPWFDWTLSTKRAVNVLNYIYNKNVLSPNKMTATGHGEYKPIVPHNGTEENRVQNRRVEIHVSRAGAEELSLNEIYDQMNEKKTEPAA